METNSQNSLVETQQWHQFHQCLKDFDGSVSHSSFQREGTRCAPLQSSHCNALVISSRCLTMHSNRIRTSDLPNAASKQSIYSAKKIAFPHTSIALSQTTLRHALARQGITNFFLEKRVQKFIMVESLEKIPNVSILKYGQNRKIGRKMELQRQEY